MGPLSGGDSSPGSHHHHHSLTALNGQPGSSSSGMGLILSPVGSDHEAYHLDMDQHQQQQQHGQPFKQEVADGTDNNNAYS